MHRFARLPAALLAPALLLAGCVSASEQRSYSVREVSDNLAALDGRTLFVHGYAKGCEHANTCVLSKGPQGTFGEAELPLAYDPEIYAMLQKADGYKVLIEADISDPGENRIYVGVWPVLTARRLIRAY